MPTRSRLTLKSWLFGSSARLEEGMAALLEALRLCARHTSFKSQHRGQTITLVYHIRLPIATPPAQIISPERRKSRDRQRKDPTHDFGRSTQVCRVRSRDGRDRKAQVLTEVELRFIIDVAISSFREASRRETLLDQSSVRQFGTLSSTQTHSSSGAFVTSGWKERQQE